jgi:hypothetical protein
VEDAMQLLRIKPLPARTPVATALEQMEGSGCAYALVARDGAEWSAVLHDELKKAVEAGKGDAALEAVFPLESLPRLFPGSLLDGALRFFGAHRVLPVVSRVVPPQVVGTLTLEDVYKVYGIKNG